MAESDLRCLGPISPSPPSLRELMSHEAKNAGSMKPRIVALLPDESVTPASIWAALPTIDRQVSGLSYRPSVGRRKHEVEVALRAGKLHS